MYIILGYLGFGNYGDEILANLLEARLKAKYGSKAVIKRLSSKTSWLEHLQVIFKCKKVFAIGGMFQDLSGPFSIFYYSIVILIAKLFSKEIIIFAQGIGPLQNPISRFVVDKIFRLANQISVRDEDSSSFLQDCKIPHIAVYDWAWVLIDEIDNIDIKKFLKISHNSVCIALRCSQFINDEFIEKISSLIDSPKQKLIFLEMQKRDHEVNSRLLNSLKSNPEATFIRAEDFSPQELIYLFKNYCSSIYTMRYHAGLIAKIAGIEVNLIDCDPKMVSLSKQISANTLEQLYKKAKLSEELL